MLIQVGVWAIRNRVLSKDRSNNLERHGELKGSVQLQSKYNSKIQNKRPILNSQNPSSFLRIKKVLKDKNEETRSQINQKQKILWISPIKSIDLNS